MKLKIIDNSSFVNEILFILKSQKKKKKIYFKKFKNLHKHFKILNLKKKPLKI
jgi:hypothetical protein